MAKIDKLVAEASTHLQPGEAAISSVMGAYECKVMGKDSVRNGVFLATDRRIFFFGKKMFGYDSESFPYSSISSMEIGKGMMGKTVSFFASSNKVKMKWINAGDFDGFMNVVQSNIGKKPEPIAQQQQPDAADQLQKLAALRDSGILTEDEFTAKKRQILGI